MPSRFLNNIKINEQYSLPNADGSADQIIKTDGAGQLSFVDQSTINAGNAEHVIIYAKNTSGASISKGTPVYITGTVGATDTVEIAPANANDSTKMPAVGLLDDTLANNAFGYVITGGFMDNITTDPIDGVTPSSNDTVYVKPGGGLTLTKPTGANFIQNVAKVGKVSGGNSGSLIVSSILRTNDVPTPLYVDHTNQRLGIGVPQPTNKLHVYGDIRLGTTGDFFISQSPFATDTFYVRTANSGTVFFGAPTSFQQNVTAQGDLYAAGGSSSTAIGTKRFGTWSNKIVDTGNNYFNLQGGNFGIGTTSPSSKLQVNGDLTVGDDSTVGSFINVIAAGASQDAGIRFGSESNTDSKAAIYTNTSNSDLHFDVTETTRMLIDSATGNVGIGTTSPQEKLHVQNYTTGESHQAMFKGGAVTVGDYSYISLNNGYSTEYNKEVRLAAVSEQSNSNKTGFAILTSPDANGASGHERLRVTADGNVGIGTTSPGSKLEVSGEIDANGGDGYRIETKPFANWGSDLLTLGDWDGEGYETRIMGSSSSEVMRVTDTKVGIGTTSPTDKLTVENGNIRLNSTSSSVSQGLFARSNNSSPPMGGISWNQNPGFIGSEWYHYKQSSPYTQARIRLIGDASGQMNVNLNNSQVFTILASNGGVGIANTSPTGLLVVGAGTSNTNDRSNTLLSEESTGSTANSLGLVNSSLGAYGNETALNFHLSRTYSPTARIIAYQDGSSSMTDTGLKFFTYNGSLQQRMTIDHDGYVGIGVTSPGAKLDIFNAGGSAGTLAACQTYSALTIKPYSSVDSKLTFSANGVSTQLIQATNNAGTNGRQISLQPFSGDVGIGVILPSEKLDVNGHIKAFNGYKGYVSYFHNAGFFHSPRSQDGANPLWIPINTTGMSSSDQYYNTWVPLYAGRVRKIIIKHVSGSTPVATVCTFRKKINGVLSSTTYAGTVTGGGAAGMKVTFDFGISNFTFNAEDEVQIGIVTGVATQPRMGGVSCQIWYEYNIT